MADQVKQLAFRELTTSEITNGSAVNVLTTDASTHYVIKSIEATQGSSTAVAATATLGLTAGLAAGEYTSLGTIAKQDRLGLSGSAIMDASSTLTVRPTAQAINYSDEKIYLGGENSAVSRIYHKAVNPSINGVTDASLNTETTIDKTSVTYSGGTYDTMGNYPGNHIIQHTNANGVDLRIVFYNGTSSGCSFEVYNATDGTFYGYYYDSYDAPQFDGERYIFWVAADGASTTRIKWYDLDESTANLAAANTLGGASGSDFCHGQTAVWADSPSINSRTSYDNHLNCFYNNRHIDGRRYLVGWSGSSYKMWMCEIPATLTNDSSTTPAPKWLYLSGTSNTSNGTDRFGNNPGSAWDIYYNIYNQANPTQTSQLRLTYDPDKQLYYLYYCYSNNQWFMWAFSQSDWDTRTSGNTILEPYGGGQGLRTVSYDSYDEVNHNSNVFINWGSNNGYIWPRGSSYYSLWGNAYPAQDAPVFMDGQNWYFKDDNSGNTSSYRKCIKLDMKAADSFVNMFPNTTVSASYNPDLFVAFATPDASTIASRTYSNAPGLKIRITGVLSDQ